ncbi:MAG: ATP-binding cassette domain-containing protein [Methanosarcinaceae archaeon]|mgnify:CR=1 FL=1|nr:ATP-binding cassette domain-containing protein [Methanosarcinaceae archaeon]
MTNNENETPLVEFHNISVKRSGNYLLKSMSLKIMPKEHIAIIGPNGSGKSSLMKVITRDYYPVARQNSYAKIMGSRLWDVFELRKNMGIITTDLQYQCDKTEARVFEIVLSGFFSSINVHKNHNVTTDMKFAVNDALKRMGIEHLANRKMTEISTGEARKVLIARALVHKPKALILDEPTNSLDLKATNEFLKTISELSKEVTVVLVTHELSDIIKEIDRVVLIKEGTVFADGNKKEILNSEKLSELFSAPVKVKEENGIYSAQIERL